MSTVIVFGPTGKVGSLVALNVALAGHKTILAMRDPSKPIPVLESDSNSYTRVKADLSDPASVSAAVKETGAKSAFIYVPPGTRDALRDTLEALKDAGIEFVVFLSSYSINGTGQELSSIPQEEIIPYMHASVELNLKAVFGSAYVGLRAGGFATNTLAWVDGVRAGTVKLYMPKFEFDYIAEADIARVGASILTSKDRQAIPQELLVIGPRLVTQEAAVGIIAKTIGKEVKVEELSYEQGVQFAISSGIPPFVAKYLYGKLSTGEGGFTQALISEGSGNIERYTGRKAETYEDWAERNKAVFSG